MAFWVKQNQRVDLTFTKAGEPVPYTYKKYLGPFEYLSDAEEVIDNDYSDWEIIEFDG